MQKQTKNKALKINLKNMFLIEGILTLLFLIFGFSIYIKPYLSENTVGILSGIFFLLFGALNVFKTISNPKNKLYKYSILFGAITLILGLFTLLVPVLIAKGYFYIISLLIGMYLIINSLNKLCDTFTLKSKFQPWVIMLVVSIIILIFGILIAINPIKSMDPIEASGIYILLSSILSLAYTIMLFNKSKDLEKIVLKKK